MKDVNETEEALQAVVRKTSCGRAWRRSSNYVNMYRFWQIHLKQDSVHSH